MYEESVGIVETKYFNIEEPIELDSGETLDNVTVMKLMVSLTRKSPMLF